MFLLLTLSLSAFNIYGQNGCGIPDSYTPILHKTDNFTIPRDTVVNLMKKTILSSGIKVGDTLFVAYEVDALFFSKFTDSTSCYKYVARLVHNIDSIYKTEIGIRVAISYFGIQKKKNFYGQVNNATSSLACDSFRHYWNTHRKSIKRTTAQLITWAGNGGGGYGMQASLNNMYAYSVVGLTANNDFSYTSYDVYIMAHELGHNCGAQHTHSCAYGVAVDSCVGGCFTGPTKLSKGSIMSYCLQIGPKSPNLSYLLSRAYQVGIAENREAITNFAKVISLGSGKINVISTRPITKTNVFDLNGRMINSISNGGIEFSIQIPSGIYILELSSGDYLQRVKIVVL